MKFSSYRVDAAEWPVLLDIKEHYDISMKIGELVLFPTVRQQPDEVIIAAPGTSCRHQIHDGTGKNAQHPIEILFEALV